MGKTEFDEGFFSFFYQGIIIEIPQLFYKQHFNIPKHSTKHSRWNHRTF